MFMKYALWNCLILIIPIGTDVQAQTPLVLQSETPIQIRLDQGVSSADARIGDPVRFETTNDVLASGSVLIPHGTPVSAIVSAVKRYEIGGKGGMLKLKLESLKLPNGLNVAINARSASQTSTTKTTMTGGVVATAVAAGGPSPLAVFATQNDAALAKGTVIVAYVQQTVSIDPTKIIKAGSSTSTAPSLVSFPNFLTNEIIIAMKQAGLSDDQIVAKIQSTPGSYRTDPADLQVLKKAGLSQTVLQAMINAQAGK